MAEEIHLRCQRAQVICVQGDTGCGKSSVVPLILSQGTEDPSIAVTQPRRLAAISLAQRVASQVGGGVGGRVGYRVAMEGKVSPDTSICFVTAGWLLMNLAHQPKALRKYSHIVLDEIHERDLDMDLLCLLLKQSLRKNSYLRVVLMSATVDASEFLDYFRQAGVAVDPEPIVVGMRRFPTWPFFLDDLAYRSAMPGLEQADLEICKKVCGKTKSADGRVDVNASLFKLCVSIVRLLAKPGLCILIFLPGLAEIEQAYEAFLSQKGGVQAAARLQFIMLHSIIPQDAQKQALMPPRGGHCKVILSTNIAESSITIPDVRYILDFGIIRKMVFDDDRGQLSLSNCWSSKATCTQRQGRCGRLQEGSIIYLFSSQLHAQMRDFAEPEVVNVPLESAYLKTKVLLPKLGSPQELLQQLLCAPPQERVACTERCLLEQGALDERGRVTGLGRFAVLMPTTVRLTRLVLLSWALGCPCDGIAMAAALSVADAFKLVNHQSVSKATQLPGAIRENYLSRVHFDGGNFSEPIAYRNLFAESLAQHGASRRDWLDRNCVSAPRLKQLSALCIELAVKLQNAVPQAKEHPALAVLARHRPGQRWPARQDVWQLFTKDTELLHFLLAAAFAPSFVVGEVGVKRSPQYEKAGKLGLNPDRTAVLQSLKPEGMRDEAALRSLCNELAPTGRIVVNGQTAFVECRDEPGGFGSAWWPSRFSPHCDVVQQMPELAQLLFQLGHQPCKFEAVGGPHEASRLATVQFPNTVRWSVMGQPKGTARANWRSPVGHLSEARSGIAAHWAVCSAIIGADTGGGPLSFRATGVTVLPPPGCAVGAVMVLAFLAGPFAFRLLGSASNPDLAKGAEIWNTAEPSDAPSVVTFSPIVFEPEELIDLLNPLREALSKFLVWPGESKADECSQTLAKLREVIEAKEEETPLGNNDFSPHAKYKVNEDFDSPICLVRLSPRPSGGFEHLELADLDSLTEDGPGSDDRPGGRWGEAEELPPIVRISGGSGWYLEVAPSWLTQARQDLLEELVADLHTLKGLFGLDFARISATYHGVKLELAAPGRRQLGEARFDLFKPNGLLQYYGKAVNGAGSYLDELGQDDAATDGTQADPWSEPPALEGSSSIRLWDTEGTAAWDSGEAELQADSPFSFFQASVGEDSTPYGADQGRNDFAGAEADESWDTVPQAQAHGGWTVSDEAVSPTIAARAGQRRRRRSSRRSGGAKSASPAPPAPRSHSEPRDGSEARKEAFRGSLAAKGVERRPAGASGGTGTEGARRVWTAAVVSPPEQLRGEVAARIGSRSRGAARARSRPRASQNGRGSGQPTAGACARLPVQIQELFLRLRLPEKTAEAIAFAEEVGAASAEQLLVECGEELGNALDLKPLEQKRLLREGERLLAKA